jgi:Trk K+ transport system NAD-binding subunit
MRIGIIGLGRVGSSVAIFMIVVGINPVDIERER